MSLTLDELMIKHGCDKSSLGHSFAKRYEPFLEPLRSFAINILEVGIQFGNSARMWLEAFPKARVYGVDHMPCLSVDDSRFHFSIGDQRDIGFWNEWKQNSPMMDVIVDDCCHFADASKIMFEALWSHLTPGGLYSIEDTCVWDETEFVSPVNGYDWLLRLIRNVNWHGKQYGGKLHHAPFVLTDFEKSIDSIHCSKHLVLLVKK